MLKNQHHTLDDCPKIDYIIYELEKHEGNIQNKTQ